MPSFGVNSTQWTATVSVIAGSGVVIVVNGWDLDGAFIDCSLQLSRAIQSEFFQGFDLLFQLRI